MSDLSLSSAQAKDGAHLRAFTIMQDKVLPGLEIIALRRRRGKRRKPWFKGFSPRACCWTSAAAAKPLMLIQKVVLFTLVARLCTEEPAFECCSIVGRLCSLLEQQASSTSQPLQCKTSLLLCRQVQSDCSVTHAAFSDTKQCHSCCSMCLLQAS